MRIFLFSLLAAAALVAAAVPAAAQSRSSTGRHQPQPEQPVEAVPDTMPAPPPAPGWFLGLTGGVGMGSDLFTVDVPGGVPVRWISDAPFTSDHFDTSLDGAAQFGLFCGRRLGDRVSLRADVTWADMAVAAEARTGQVGDVYQYDSYSVMTMTLGAEFRLVRTASHPYLGAALAAVKISPRREDGLAQTNLGASLNLGYQQVLDPRWSLRLEGRVTRTGFDVGDWVPRAASTTQPEVVVEGEPDVTTWSLVLGVQIEI